MRYAVALFLAICLASLTPAQVDMSGMGKMQAEPSSALQRREIRKELKLTKQQNSDIDKIEKDLMGAMSTGPKNNNPDMMAPYEKMKEADEKILAVFDDAQKKRFSELAIQMQGAPAVANPEIAGPLGLTDDQIGQVKQIQSSYMDDAVKVLRSSATSRGVYDKIDKMRDERDAKILQILNQTQRDKFKEMEGTPFKGARQKGTFF